MTEQEQATNKTFADYVKFHRAKLNISRNELARRVGVTPQYLMDIERERGIPNEDKIEKLVEVLQGDRREAFQLADKLPLDVIEKIKNAYYNGEDV
jgi:transcriptional regulator with XRE-family HTH domain